MPTPRATSRTPRYALRLARPTGTKTRRYSTRADLKEAYESEVAFWFGGNRRNMGSNPPPRIHGVDTRTGEVIFG